MSMLIKIDDVLIAEADVPNAVSLDSAALKHTVLYTASGRKILKIAGLDQDDIALDGDLRDVSRGGPYPTPLQKMTRLAALRDAGKPVVFIYGTRSIRDVTITDFKPHILMGNAVRYTLVLSRAINGTPPLSATVSSREQADRHKGTIRDQAPAVGPGMTAAADYALSLMAAWENDPRNNGYTPKPPPGYNPNSLQQIQPPKR